MMLFRWNGEITTNPQSERRLTEKNSLFNNAGEEREKAITFGFGGYPLFFLLLP